MLLFLYCFIVSQFSKTASPESWPSTTWPARISSWESCPEAPYAYWDWFAVSLVTVAVEDDLYNNKRVEILWCSHPCWSFPIAEWLGETGALAKARNIATAGHSRWPKATLFPYWQGVHCTFPSCLLRALWTHCTTILWKNINKIKLLIEKNRTEVHIVF